MQRKGNSNSAVCVNNLLKIARGEVPYDRVKGISFARLDTPIASAPDAIVDDAKWMLGTYEPRASIESVEAVLTDAPNGHIIVKANINTIKEAAT